jgi:hypothetical protein
MRSAGKLDLAIGVLLGLAAGLALAYLLVFVIGGGGNASSISTGTDAPPNSSTRKSEPPGRVAPRPPGQRR